MEKKFTVQEIIKRMIGVVVPVGETNEDEKRFENLKDLCDLVEDLIGIIGEVSEKNSYEHSVKRASDYAKRFLKENIGIE